MGVITKIVKQKKAQNRYNIYIDDTYAFSVTEDVLVKYHLHKGKTLSDDEKEEIVASDHFQQHYQKAIHFLSFRMRSEAEMRRYLQQKGVDEKAIEQIITQLYREKLLEDAQFASMFVHDRLRHSQKGPLLIQQELLERGVAKAHIEAALSQYDETQQLAKIHQWLEKEQKRQSSYPQRKRIEQIKRKLYQRGFSLDIITQALHEWTFTQNETEERELFKKQANKLYNKYRKKYAGSELILRLKQALYQRGFESDLIQSYIDTLDEQ